MDKNITDINNKSNSISIATPSAETKKSRKQISTDIFLSVDLKTDEWRVLKTRTVARPDDIWASATIRCAHFILHLFYYFKPHSILPSSSGRKRRKEEKFFLKK